eukprot:TRINITY_DN52977_c0_g1_i1.p1 TRINITY_DN52977_c0_g1~~TRINITY_DN52977_c0_g1_i1.p1  ORF type:complete len:132 (+),score=26.81 TRINITY_DN52977_c0_g1_i1:38-397(+)
MCIRDSLQAQLKALEVEKAHADQLLQLADTAIQQEVVKSDKLSYQLSVAAERHVGLQETVANLRQRLRTSERSTRSSSLQPGVHQSVEKARVSEPRFARFQSQVNNAQQCRQRAQYNSP